MNYGGEAADQIVRYSLEGIDCSLRLSGTLAKNLAVFFAAVLKDQKKTYGKTRMVRMLKENRPLKFFTVPSDRLKEFSREGKKRGLLYVVIRDKKNPERCELMVFADDAAKVNRVMDKMNLDFLKSESGEAIQEVVMEANKNQNVTENQVKTVEMPEGEITFEFGDMEKDFGFEETVPDSENFIQAREEKNLSEPSWRSKNISTGQGKSKDRTNNVENGRRVGKSFCPYRAQSNQTGKTGVCKKERSPKEPRKESFHRKKEEKKDKGKVM